jgi:hypothetical protein
LIWLIIRIHKTRPRVFSALNKCAGLAPIFDNAFFIRRRFAPLNCSHCFFIFEIVLVFFSTVKLRNVNLTDLKKGLGPMMGLQSKSGAENCARSTFI